MKIKSPVALVGLLLSIGALVAIQSLTRAQEEGDKAKPKYTIEEVMEKAHGAKLINKVMAGDASDAEKNLLLDLYLSLPENKPPKGDAASWQKFTNAAVMGAARVVVGRDGAEKQLKAAVNCAGCHRAHKPPEEN